MPSQVSMSQDYKRKFTFLWSMLSRATLSRIEYLCYLFHIHGLGRENKSDNIFPFNRVQCFSAYRLLLQNARGWVVYKPHYFSQFWRLEVQDQGASMVN